MSELTKDGVLEALKQVEEPELKQDLVTVGMVESVAVDSRAVDVVLRLTTPACPMKGELKRRTAAGITAVFGEDVAVTVRFSEERLTPPGRPEKKTLEGVRDVILIGSGKGGVGKSTVAYNVALSLAASGARVGLMDGDLYGPSLPILAGIRGEKLMMAPDGTKILPVEKHGLKIISLGLMVRDTDAVVWRGPLLHKTIEQFYNDVAWGELDYLIIDLPPGTGDIQLSISQLTTVSGALVVTTPQQVAFADVLRAARMFEKLEIPLLGLVENMSFFDAPDTGARYWPFGKGRIKAECNKNEIPYLGAIPMVARIAEACDAGELVHEGQGNEGIREYYERIGGVIASTLSQATFKVL